MIRIGTSGWMYDHWVGVFYPTDLAREEWLSFYAGAFQTVEVNNTFYHLPSRDAVAGWEANVPEGFLFAIKANRYITHIKNLLDPQEAVGNLLDRIAVLGGKLGPILFQLPPHWHVNAGRLRDFVGTLPAGRRYAFEFREPTWYTDEVYDILRQGGHAFCMHDHRDAPSSERVTADFAYVRFHGRTGAYEGRYSAADLSAWAHKLAGWDGEGIDVYVYFNNDWRGHAVGNATELKELLAGQR